jgi:acyl-CoA thioesterase-1
MTLIVGLGDSTTAGTPLFQSPIEAPPSGRGDPRSQYAYWLTQQHPDWQVLNRGVNGERSDQIAARFSRDVVSASPEVVVILAGVNDVYQGRTAETVIAQLETMYARAAAAHIKVAAATIVPYNMAAPAANAAMHAINAWIAEEGRRNANIRVADTRRAAAAASDPDKLAGSPDGLHPDVDGYRRMAEAIEPAIVQLLASGITP